MNARDELLLLGYLAEPPSAPTNLTSSTLESAEVGLVWEDQSDNEDGFIVERSPNGTTGWVEIVDEAADIDQFLDTGLTPVTAYFYRVKAYNAAGDSDYSNTLSIVTLNTVTVTVEVLNCVGGAGDVQITLTDPQGAIVEIEDEQENEWGGNEVVINLPRGNYTWALELASGYEAVGPSSGSFQVCPIERTVRKLISTSSLD